MDHERDAVNDDDTAVDSDNSDREADDDDDVQYVGFQCVCGVCVCWYRITAPAACGRHYWLGRRRGVKVCSRLTRTRFTPLQWRTLRYN